MVCCLKHVTIDTFLFSYVTVT